MKTDDKTATAIALALHLYLDESVHDKESFVITIKRNPTSAWMLKGQNFRQLPIKKM